jgi:hypothetical protein
LQIVHDLAAQRSAPAGDNLNHRLHSTLRFSRKSVPLQCLFQAQPRSRFAERSSYRSTSEQNMT